jgi:hypothetical protein
MPQDSSRPVAHRTAGFWLAAVVAVFLVVNTVRSFFAPAAFAGYFGAPLASVEDTAWVIVYALRTGLIAAIIFLLLATRQLLLLAWVSLFGAVLPVGDFFLAQSAGAPTSTLIRHGAIGVFLLITAWRLFAYGPSTR